jgi:hypothetical protein
MEEMHMINSAAIRVMQREDPSRKNEIIRTLGAKVEVSEAEERKQA